MKGFVRAILFGGGWSFALLAIGLLVALPEAAHVTNREPIVIGVCSAIASAVVLWTATRLPAAPSWPIAIVGWVVGFFLLPGAVRVLLAIADQMTASGV
jgi:hypothetical protein